MKDEAGVGRWESSTLNPQPSINAGGVGREPSTFNSQPSTSEGLEALLREAAEFAPARDAAPGLAGRGLERCRQRRERTRRRLKGAAVGGVLCALGLLAINLRAGSPLPPSHKAPSPSLVVADRREEGPPLGTKPLRQVGGFDAAWAGGRAMRPDGTRRRRRPARRSRPSLLARSTRSRSRDRLANWKTEVVRGTTGRVVAPGWILEPDGDEGDWRLSPGVLDLPLSPEMTAALTCTVPGDAQGDGADTAPTFGKDLK